MHNSVLYSLLVTIHNKRKESPLALYEGLHPLGLSFSPLSKEAKTT